MPRYGAVLPTAPGTSRLVASGIELRRRGRLLARGLRATVEPGESLLVSGRNGAGKSTLLRVLAGVAAPSAGRLQRPLPPHAYVPERVALAPTMPVHAWLSAMHRVRSRAPAAAGGPAAPGGPHPDLAGLDPDLAARSAATLSKGELQRVVLAEALSCRPALLVLDEPWAGLDGPGRQWLAGQLRSCLRDGAIAVVTDHSGVGLGLLDADHRLHLGDAPPPGPQPQGGDVEIVAGPTRSGRRGRSPRCWPSR